MTADPGPAGRAGAGVGQAAGVTVVADVELGGELPRLADHTAQGAPVDAAWVLVRVCTEPLGVLRLPVPAGGLAPEELASAARAAFGEAPWQRLAAARLRPDPYLAGRERALADAPAITVVVCTRNRPAGLRRCLDSVLAQGYPRLRLLVVDNAPDGDATRRLVAALPGVEYLCEPRPGLSRARNAALRAAPQDLLAWLDDDEVADRYWLAELARALVEHPAADVVTGPVLPAELTTPAQHWFEEYGGHSKGRGLAPALFTPPYRQHPLYPLPPFGAGANMAWRPGVAQRLGGFDPALGAGSPALGGEDTVAFARLLLAGGTIAYHPGALTWHRHRAGVDELERQLYGYGLGLTAGYTSLLLRRPGLLVPLLRLLPTALRDLRAADGPRLAGVSADFPARLRSAGRRGMLRGPAAYLRGRLRRRG